MTTHDLIEQLMEVARALSNESQLIQKLSTISNPTLYQRIDEVISATSDQLLTMRISNLRDEFKDLIRILNQVPPRKLFVEIHILSSLLSNFQVASNYGNNAISPLTKQLEEFAELYERFFREPKPSKALELSVSAGTLYQSILITRDLLTKLKLALEPVIDIGQSNKEASILLPYICDFKDMLMKLEAINAMYAELSFLMNVSVTEYPLQIIKIESGSLWIKIFGESRVITVLISFMESAVAFLYRNFTNEGKISYIPKKIDSIEAILHLSQKLEEQGIETSGIKENLQKSAIIISSELNSLLLGEPSIRINDETYSIKSTLQEKYLAESRRLLLEEGDPPKENNSSH